MRPCGEDAGWKGAWMGVLGRGAPGEEPLPHGNPAPRGPPSPHDPPAPQCHLFHSGLLRPVRTLRTRRKPTTQERTMGVGAPLRGGSGEWTFRGAVRGSRPPRPLHLVLQTWNHSEMQS